MTQHLTRGPYRSIVPSPNGRFLALISAAPSSAADPHLWVTSSDFARSLSEFAITADVSEGERGPPRAVEWCGSNSVVLGWDRTVVMVGPFGETLKYARAFRSRFWHSPPPPRRGPPSFTAESLESRVADCDPPLSGSSMLIPSTS